MVERLQLAIIGGGPAGLSAALEAERLGVRHVAVFEREAEAGGAVRHCGHLGFGMLDFGRLWTGPRYARALQAAAARLDIRTSHAVTLIEPGGRMSVSTPNGVKTILADRVLLASGIREKPRSARLVSGGRPFGVMNTGALQRFVYLHGKLPFRNPVIVGVELVAFSTILTLRHGGAKPVAILGEGEAKLGGHVLGSMARFVCGVPLRSSARAVAILGRSYVEGLVVEENGERQTIECDGVVFSGQWLPEAYLMQMHPAGIDAETGGPSVDCELRTADPSLFAAGNVRFGVRSSGLCAIEGREAARIVAAELGVGLSR